MLLRVRAVVGNFSLLAFSELRAQWTLQKSAFAIVTPNPPGFSGPETVRKLK